MVWSVCCHREHLFEVRHWQELLKSGQEVTHQRLQGCVEVLVKRTLRHRDRLLDLTLWKIWTAQRLFFAGKPSLKINFQPLV